MKSRKVILFFPVFVFIAFLFFLNDPLRRSEGYLRSYVLNITPSGTSFNDVLEAIRKKGWQITSVNESSGFYHQGKKPRKIVGQKSIRASLGDYQSIPFEVNVTVYWGFDDKGSLLDIWVWKTWNGF